MKLYERIENNNFDEIDRNRAIELIEGGNGHLVYNENYFKLQNENEELKRERNNNYRMIALAQNEVLGYMQGYEDGKKLKRSAVACIVENQQYYIIQKQFEHYKKRIEELKEINEELKQEMEKRKWVHIKENGEVEPLFYISKDKIREKIKELEEEKKYYYSQYKIEELNDKIQVLQELIEEREEK